MDRSLVHEAKLIDWLREQRKFAGMEALKHQIGRDLEQVRQRAGLDPARPIAVVA